MLLQWNWVTGIRVSLVDGIVLKIMNHTKIKSVRKPKSENIEIELELESGLVVDFVPDFRMQTNISDQTNLSWGLSNSKSQGNVVILFPEFPDESTIYTIGPDGTDV